MEDLLDRLYAAGFVVELTGSGPHLLPLETGLTVPPDLLAELKANRAGVIAHLRAQEPPRLSDAEFCQGCARPVHPDDRGVLAGSYALCDRVTCPWKGKR